MTMTKRRTGILKSVLMTTDEENRPVMRAIVDFYDDNAPEANMGTIWNQRPVQIVEVAADGEQSPPAKEG